MARYAAVGALVLFVAGATAWLLTPREAFMPAGGVALGLDVKPGLPLPALGCQLALHGPVIVERDGNVLAFRAELDGEVAQIRWPAGWTARLVNGRAELVQPDLAVFAREGDVIRDALVGGVADDGTFLVCQIAAPRPKPRVVMPSPGYVAPY